MSTGRSTLEGADVAKRVMELLAIGERADFDVVVHPEAVNREAIIEPPACRGTGPAATYATAVWLRSAFADLQFAVHYATVGEGVVALDTTMSGRHSGPFVSYTDAAKVDRVFPPTGKTFAVKQSHWFVVQDGMMIDHWATRDDLGQARQLGWLPPTPTYLLRMALAKHRATRQA